MAKTGAACSTPFIFNSVEWRLGTATSNWLPLSVLFSLANFSLIRSIWLELVIESLPRLFRLLFVFAKSCDSERPPVVNVSRRCFMYLFERDVFVAIEPVTDDDIRESSGSLTRLDCSSNLSEVWGERISFWRVAVVVVVVLLRVVACWGACKRELCMDSVDEARSRSYKCFMRFMYLDVGLFFNFKYWILFIRKRFLKLKINKKKIILFYLV